MNSKVSSNEKGETLFIVMPAYNEEENIKKVVSDWYPMLEYGDENSRLVVSDGGSKDKTLDILYELKGSYEKLEVLPRPGTDHGTKVIYLYKYAIENGANWIFQTDSDGQTDPTEFQGFWRDRKEFDAIIGNRVIRGDGLFRKFIEDIARLYVRAFWGVWVPDTGAPFRLMRADAVNKYVWMMKETFNLPNPFITACMKKYERTMFKKITFLPRQGGKNYINIWRIAKIGFGSARNFIELRKKLNEYERETTKRGE
jgi:glycosyltransferase involved in cell wall biosynthesis